MIVIPAIDIKDSKVVRLYRGDFKEVKIYSDDPVSIAKKWESDGAKLLHIVDLDGALSGELKNVASVKNIINAISIPVEVGGGIRSRDSIEKLLSAGARYVILGTRACEDEKFVKSVIADFGDKIIVSIDAKDGMVATAGWISVSEIKATDLLVKLESFGLETIIYTDISRDGTLEGPNFVSLKDILKARRKSNIISSGGVSSLEDLINLKQYESQGLLGAIVGKAIYENKLNLKDAIKKC